MLVRGKQQWHRQADVVVIGLGLAGAVSAITAHDNGAEVIVIEKQDAERHVSNSSMSGGVFICPSNVDDAVSYMESLYRVAEGVYWTDKDIIRVWAEYCAENKAWIERLGGSVATLAWLGEHIDIPGYRSIQTYVCKG
ncbi:MAG: FAD-binding protein, partial [Pseudomonadota bacterium]